MEIQTIIAVVVPLLMTSVMASNKGTSFTVVFMANYDNSKSYYNHLMITAETQASISISRYGVSPVTGTAYPNKPFILRFDGNTRADDGVDNKAIFVTSDVPVSVFGSNNVYTAGDSFMALPNSADATSFIIPSNDPFPHGGFRRSGLVVGAVQDGTQVELYSASRTLVSRTIINRQQTWQYTSNDKDLTGYYVNASATVSVFSGGPCLNVAGKRTSVCDHNVEQVPPIAGLKNYHITTPIAGRNAGIGYLYRVIAAYNNTRVTIVSSTVTTTKILYQGEFFEVNNTQNSADTISCSYPCLVPLYNKGNGLDSASGSFMMYSGSPEALTRHAAFTTANNTRPNTLRHFISIIVTTQYISRLSLDGLGLKNKTWTVVPNTDFSSTSFSLYNGVARGQHVLSLSGNYGGFFANVYGHHIDEAYGFPTGIGGIDIYSTTTVTRPTSTVTLTPARTTKNPYTTGSGSSTTSTPRGPVIRPLRRLVLNGTFYTTNQEPISSECQGSYWADVADSATVVTGKLNQQIASGTICPGQTDTVVDTPDTATGVQNNKGTVDLRYDVVPGSVTFLEAETCSATMSSFIQNHNNWNTPIIKPSPGCPNVQFQPVRFDDAGQLWSCNGYDAEPGVRPYMTIRLLGYVKTQGDDISFICKDKYKDQLSEKSSQMVALVNDLISIGQLCSNAKTQRLTGNDVGVNAENTEMSTILNFKMFTPDSSTFPQTEVCATDISKYLQKHDNWQRPIIGVVPGCPTVSFDPPKFEEDAQEWICE